MLTTVQFLHFLLPRPRACSFAAGKVVDLNRLVEFWPAKTAPTVIVCLVRLINARLLRDRVLIAVIAFAFR